MCKKSVKISYLLCWIQFFGDQRQNTVNTSGQACKTFHLRSSRNGLVCIDSVVCIQLRFIFPEKHTKTSYDGKTCKKYFSSFLHRFFWRNNEQKGRTLLYLTQLQGLQFSASFIYYSTIVQPIQVTHIWPVSEIKWLQHQSFFINLSLGNNNIG